jgi:hypothetical protein
MSTPATRVKKSAAAIRGAKTLGQSKTRSLARNFTSEPPSMEEPRLRDMLKDPILLSLMQSDGVEPAHLMRILAVARRALPQ